MHIAEVNVRRSINAYSRRERRTRTSYAITVIVRNGEIAAVINLQRKRFRALPGLLLGLRRVDVPVLYVIKLDLVAHVMLVRQLVHVPGRLRVRNQKARLRESIRRPDVCECSSASIRNPQAGILPVPALVQVRVSRVVVVVRIAAAAVPAEKAHIIHQRLLARLPQHSYRTRVDTAREDSDPADDVLAARRRKKHCLRRTHSLVSRCLIQQVDLRERGMQPDQHRVRLERQACRAPRNAHREDKVRDAY